ncbi:MAG TPA: hypothetical protein VLT62_04030 [Candidatus Methylomirabilis sp.]|nr:hypothetical protein [Candidatus Methylomirabilis sp.]
MSARPAGRQTWVLCVAGSVLFFFWTGAAVAQEFRLGTWEGAVETLFDFDRQDTTTTGSPQSRFQSTLALEQLTLRNVGAYIFDPRIFTFSLGGTFGLTQEWFKTDTESGFRDGNLWGYDASASLLPDQAYSLNLFANRNQYFLPQELAGRTQLTTENWGGTLFAKRLYIPSSLSFVQEFRDDISRTGDVTTRREERRNTIRYEGLRGWVDSEMDLRYEFVDLSDLTLPSLSYRSHEGAFNYSRDFGTELNWYWDSRLRGYWRTGVADLTSFTADEVLSIDHSDRFRTSYGYHYLLTDTQGGNAATHTGDFSLRHQLYESLVTTLRLNATLQRPPDGRRDTYRSRLDLNYTKRLPGQGLLTAGLGGGLQYEDDRSSSSESFVPQETLTFATPIALPIALQNPFVVASSVVVTKVAVGPLPAGCIQPPGPPTPLVLGQDYNLQNVGDFTQIVPITCAGVTPGINPGDTIAVDYRFAVSPSISFLRTIWHADLSLDYRWIRPYYSHEQIDERLLSGQDGQFLNDQRSDAAGIEFRYIGNRLYGSVLGEVRRFRSTRLSFDSARSSQFLTFVILPALTFSLNAEESFYDYQDPDRQVRSLAGRATLTYALNASLFAEALGEIRWLKDTLNPTERNTEITFRLRWLIRRIEVNPTLQFFDRRRGDTDTKEYRVVLQVIRRF